MQVIYRKSFFLSMFFLLMHSASAEVLAPENILGAKTIDTRTARLLYDQGAVFIDVRKQEDYDAGHIPKAYHLPVADSFSEQNLIALIQKEDPVVFYCNGIHCMGSSKAVQQAVAWGWSNVYYYRVGMPDWKLHNHPIDYSIKP